MQFILSGKGRKGKGRERERERKREREREREREHTKNIKLRGSKRITRLEKKRGKGKIVTEREKEKE